MERKCLVCGSSHYVIVKGNSSTTGIGDNIPLNPGIVVVSKHVCLECGHVDYYVKDEDLSRLQKKYGGKL